MTHAGSDYTAHGANHSHVHSQIKSMWEKTNQVGNQAEDKRLQPVSVSAVVHRQVLLFCFGLNAAIIAIEVTQKHTDRDADVDPIHYPDYWMRCKYLCDPRLGKDKCSADETPADGAGQHAAIQSQDREQKP